MDGITVAALVLVTVVLVAAIAYSARPIVIEPPPWWAPYYRGGGRSPSGAISPWRRYYSAAPRRWRQRFHSGPVVSKGTIPSIDYYHNDVIGSERPCCRAETNPAYL